MIREVDKVIHEPARLQILVYLASLEKTDFTFLRTETGMTQGNLSSHLNKLETAGYISVEKSYRNKRPLTLVSLTNKGKETLKAYVQNMHQYFTELLSLTK